MCVLCVVVVVVVVGVCTGLVLVNATTRKCTQTTANAHIDTVAALIGGSKTLLGLTFSGKAPVS